MCYCSRLLDCLRIFIREMTARINNELSKGTTLTNRNIATDPEIIKMGQRIWKIWLPWWKSSIEHLQVIHIFEYENQHVVNIHILCVGIIKWNLLFNFYTLQPQVSWLLIILRGTMPWCENCRVQLHPTGRSQEPYCHQAYCNSFYYRIGCRLIQQF